MRRVIITPVGTSLFTNYLKKNENIGTHYEEIKERYSEEYDSHLERIGRIKPCIKRFVEEDNSNASAEIKSILKLKSELKDDVEVRLIASDYLVSVLAAEILAENGFGKFNREMDVIKKLQVNNRDEFAKEGMKNLLNHIYRIANGYFDNLILNITGGFKATIPFLTIFGQVNNIPLYYIFEDTNTLIKIPQVPININWKIFDDNKEFFSSLERETIIKDPHFNIPQIEAILERADNLISFNSLGTILWEKYKAKFENFYLLIEAQEKFAKLNNTDKKTISKSFLELSKRLRSNPEDPDLRHGLTDCKLPQGFYCFKHKEDDRQIRILWHSEDRKTPYGLTIKDIYIASFWSGKEVHNVEAEYVKEINRFSKNNPDLVKKLEKFQTISVSKDTK